MKEEAKADAKKALLEKYWGLIREEIMVKGYETHDITAELDKLEAGIRKLSE